MVLLTVRSLASLLRIFSYSAMAFCSLPCWTNFSAALRIFCLLKPKPNAIGCGLQPFTRRTRAHSASVAERVRTSPGDSQAKPRQPHKARLRSKVIVRPGTGSAMVTDDYRGLPKGSVRPVMKKLRLPLPEREQTYHAQMPWNPFWVYSIELARSVPQLRKGHELNESEPSPHQ